MKTPLFALLACFGLAMAGLNPTAVSADPNCTCRGPGQSYALGECVCMARPDGSRQLACCGMARNNTSWKFTDKPCPVAMSDPAAPARQARLAGPRQDARDPIPIPAATPPLVAKTD